MGDTFKIWFGSRGLYENKTNNERSADTSGPLLTLFPGDMTYSSSNPWSGKRKPTFIIVIESNEGRVSAPYSKVGSNKEGAERGAEAGYD